MRTPPPSPLVMQVCTAEHNRGRFLNYNYEMGPGQLKPVEMQTFRTALNKIQMGLHGEGGTGRLVHLLSSNSGKAHDMLILGGASGCLFVCFRVLCAQMCFVCRCRCFVLG